jgi:hypothetical protein
MFTPLCRSQAIEWHVHETLSRDRERIAFYYCTRRGNAASLGDDVLYSLLGQLAESIDGFSVADAVREQYEVTWPRRLPLNVCKKLLKDLAVSNQRTTIFIDALDECEDPSRLLNDLKDLYNESGRKFKFFLSSRHSVQIYGDFPSWDKIDLNSGEELTKSDIRTYIEVQVKRRKELGFGDRLCERFRRDIEENICKNPGDRQVEALKERLKEIEELEDRLIKILTLRSQTM